MFNSLDKNMEIFKKGLSLKLFFWTAPVVTLQNKCRNKPNCGISFENQELSQQVVIFRPIRRKFIEY